MGSAIYVVLDENGGNIDTNMDGKSLSNVMDELSGLCKILAVKDLWSFCSENPEDIAEFFEGIDADLENPGEEEWFSPSDGLATVDVIMENLKSDQGTQDVMEDLKNLSRILKEAEKNNARFHLAVDY